MNTIYTMLCGCKIPESAIIKRSRKNKRGNEWMAKCCPNHNNGFLSSRERKCFDCDNLVTQDKPSANLAKRCPTCTKIFYNKTARDTAKRRYREQQEAKGLTVNDGYSNVIENIKKGIEKKAEVKTPSKFGCINLKELCGFCIRPWFRCGMRVV